MNTIMTWGAVFMAAMTLIAVFGLIGDEVRGRLFRRSQPATPRALEGLSVADMLVLIGFIVPVLLVGWSAWTNL